MTKKMYIENPYLRELKADIIEKKFRNNKFYVKLNRTIFYPNLSGGQPGDKGTMNGVEILETYEDGNDVVHILNENINEKEVEVLIDWENRLDLMQQHTGQHLLSSVFYKLYNGETVSFYISKEYVYIDVTVPDLTEDEARKVEFLANKVIQSNFNIKSYFVNKDEIQTLPLRKQPTVSTDIRIVEIEGFDYSPCGGTHLNNTGELGLIKIRKWEKYKGNVRVEFVCGNRALTDYTWKNQYIREIGLLLSSKDKDVLDKTIKLYNSKEALEKENRDLRESINKYKSEILLNEAISINGINIIKKELENVEFKEISFIANYLLNNNENLLQIYGLKNQEKGQFYISKTKDIDINLQEIYKNVSSKYDIKGGGNPNTVQGGSDMDNLTNILNYFNELAIKEIKVRKS